MKRSHHFVDLTGLKFGLLNVVRYVDNNNKNRRASRFLCRCDCGVEKVMIAQNVKKSLSCGCQTARRTKETHVTHGETSGYERTKEYRLWKSIKDRCYLKSCKSYRIYGGRGIVMHPNWIHSFENFFSHVGRAPSEAHCLDRINNDGNYELGNVRWVTAYEQARNRRTNIFLEHDGRRQCALDWANEIGVPHWTFSRRVKKGMTVMDIIEEKKMKEANV